MAPPDDAIDRAAILGRRAALIASALTGLAAPGLARAQEPAPEEPGKNEPAPADPSAQGQATADCPTSDGSPEAKSAAKKLYDEGQGLLAGERYEEAADWFGRAYTLHVHDKIAILRMQALHKSGNPEDAARFGIKHVLCGGDLETIRPVMNDIEVASARAVIVVSGANLQNGALTLDGKPIDWDRARIGVLLTPGTHVIAFQRPHSERREQSINVAVGDRVNVAIEAPPDVGPEPCLSPPCLSPCLSYFSRSALLRLESSILPPHGALTMHEPTEGFVGTGASIGLEAMITSEIYFDMSISSCFYGNDVARLVLLGSSAEIRYQDKSEELFGLAAGFSAGYMFDLGEETPGAYLRSSVYFGPMLVPVHMRFNVVQIEVRIPIWFSETSADGVTAFRPSVFAPYMALSFGDGVIGRDSE